MKIKSIRYGFANNSSSSHSIVFLGDFRADDDAEGTDSFGWDYFTAIKEQSKKEYLFATLLQAGKMAHYNATTILTEKIGWLNPEDKFDKSQQGSNYNEREQCSPQIKTFKDYSRKVEKDLQFEILLKDFSDVFGEEMIKRWLDTDYDVDEYISGIPYIDHQSVLALPIHPDGSLHAKFIKHFFQVLIKENFAILGGNDNSGEPHDLEERETYSDNLSIKAVQKVLNFIGTEGKGPVCVYDEINNDFILQKYRSGDKLRVSFEINSTTNKSAFPELVDLKITDNCDYGCTFCYQSSTKEGKHGELENIKNTIKTLANSKVMEIAIGGGEPTMHPNLLEILQFIREHNMLACFTTKNFDLHKRPDFEQIIKTANSIAFSCNSKAEIDKVLLIKEAMRDGRNYPGSEGITDVYFQMIPELMSNNAFDNSLNKLGYREKITLLGYKDFGFGEKYAPKNRFEDSSWIDTVKKYSKDKNMDFGIDSVLVSKWKKELIEKGVNPLALVGEEGKFSCYVDAVNMTIHKSSFSKEEGIKLTGHEETIKEHFATF